MAPQTHHNFDDYPFIACQPVLSKCDVVQIRSINRPVEADNDSQHICPCPGHLRKSPSDNEVAQPSYYDCNQFVCRKCAWYFRCCITTTSVTLRDERKMQAFMLKTTWGAASVNKSTHTLVASRKPSCWLNHARVRVSLGLTDTPLTYTLVSPDSQGNANHLSLFTYNKGRR